MNFFNGFGFGRNGGGCGNGFDCEDILTLIILLSILSSCNINLDDLCALIVPLFILSLCGCGGGHKHHC